MLNRRLVGCIRHAVTHLSYVMRVKKLMYRGCCDLPVTRSMLTVGHGRKDVFVGLSCSMMPGAHNSTSCCLAAVTRLTLPSTF
jgi:hypothetical protein